jgi:hypothetical protein
MLMQKIIPLVSLFITFVVCIPVQGESTVDSVLAPAWIERGLNRIPVSPGMTIHSVDRIVTGVGGKVLLKLSDASDLKLGENLEMSIDNIDESDGTATSIFTSIFDVLKGAFRFTTRQLGNNLSRDVTIQAGTATIGIRGTDVWGKVNQDRDYVILIEGKISIDRNAEATVIMGTAETVFDAPANEQSKEIVPIQIAELERLALETELESGTGIMTIGGKYRVHLASYQDFGLALEAVNRFRAQGYAVDSYDVEVGDNWWTRIAINNFASRSDADYFVKHLAQNLGVTDAWLNRTE